MKVRPLPLEHHCCCIFVFEASRSTSAERKTRPASRQSKLCVNKPMCIRSVCAQEHQRATRAKSSGQPSARDSCFSPRFSYVFLRWTTTLPRPIDQCTGIYKPLCSNRLPEKRACPQNVGENHKAKNAYAPSLVCLLSDTLHESKNFRPVGGETARDVGTTKAAQKATATNEKLNSQAAWGTRYPKSSAGFKYL